ncbi:hypothetical protein [Streptomyces griseocarneus]|uniref:hypothetical protein n=1 Tax=Streptomyces griseocarneus TaxID=51201 RepID=UPI00167DC8C7|nr:hypothetical protein [Streptomyces griseocarneus]MBZ6476452.1 hypothetical protein [Streptomyces griseocarneus]GHG78774.1 hypothetical protein GCM10018779_59050 [Streptomyces griseocarneus]
MPSPTGTGIGRPHVPAGRGHHRGAGGHYGSPPARSGTASTRTATGIGIGIGIGKAHSTCGTP